MNCILEVDSISFSYRSGRLAFLGKTRGIFQNFSMQVYAGETLGIIGRNGAGKSTLLRLIAGIHKPDRGTIKKTCHQINLLSFQLGFSDSLTGVQNIILSGMLNGISRSKILELMPAIIELSGIGNAVEDSLITYSTGMRARLGFAVAYHLNPDILLIDEILGVGDLAFQEKSSQLIKEKINSNQTTILVTHDPYLVREVCNRVIWIEQGQIKIQGECSRILDQYVRELVPEVYENYIKEEL